MTRTAALAMATSLALPVGQSSGNRCSRPTQAWAKAVSSEMPLPAVSVGALTPQLARAMLAHARLDFMTPTLAPETLTRLVPVSHGGYLCLTASTALAEGCATASSDGLTCLTCHDAIGAQLSGGSCVCSDGYFDSNNATGNLDLMCTGTALKGSHELMDAQLSVRAAAVAPGPLALCAGRATPPRAAACVCAMEASSTTMATQETWTRLALVRSLGAPHLAA